MGHFLSCFFFLRPLMQLSENEPPLDVNQPTLPEATSAGTTGKILDLNLNRTNGDSGKLCRFVSLICRDR